MNRMTKETRILTMNTLSTYFLFCYAFGTHHTGFQIEENHDGWVGGSVGSVSKAVGKEGQQQMELLLTFATIYEWNKMGQHG